MADPAKHGTVWSDDELDLIVADYFAMLAMDLAGQKPPKAERARALEALIGREHKSIEFKHMNISAVLEVLGYPLITGYRPLYNYQRAIIPAVERYLDAHPLLQMAGTPRIAAAPGMADVHTLFDGPPPALGAPKAASTPALERIARKFDPVERDFRNRELGKAGEALIFNFEQRRLRDADRADLAAKVRWVAQEDGDGAGYDIRSFEPTGQDRLIEVKTTHGHHRTPFFLTRNEMAMSEARPEAFRILRLYEFGKAPKLFTLEPPLSEHVVLETETWRAGFG